MSTTDKKILELCADFLKAKKAGVLTLEVKPNKDVLVEKKESDLFKSENKKN